MDEAEKKLREFINHRRYGPGGSLPGVGPLAKELGVTRNELRLAIAWLCYHGVVYRSPGRGFCVSPQARLPGGPPQP